MNKKDMNTFRNSPDNLIIPALGSFYDRFAQPVAWLILRIAVGGMLAFEGWPKILAPLSQSGFLESQGYYPGWLWSPVLACLQFFGGLCIVLGLLTRPAALGNGLMLLLTIYFHYSNPYGDIMLTQAGMDMLQTSSALFTPEAIALLSDGGREFLHEVQTKAEQASLFWSTSTLLFAAFGGGYLSLDRWLLKKHF